MRLVILLPICILLCFRVLHAADDGPRPQAVVAEDGTIAAPAAS